METAEYGKMDAAEDAMWWYRALHTRLIDRLDGAEGPVLDAGCGTGGFLARLAAAHPDLPAIGLDRFAAAAARAAEKSGRPTVCGSVNALPFADGSFGAVVSADVLCHAAVEPAPTLAEFRRVLRPGGRLVLNLPAHHWLKSAHDARVHNARRFARAELAGMLDAAGFGRPRLWFWNSLLLPLMILQRKVLRAAPDESSDVAHFPPWQDRLFHALTVAERRLGLPFPAGGSLLATAVKV